MNPKHLLKLGAGISAIAALSLLGAACEDEEGSGNLTSITVANMEDRDLTDVSVYDDFEVTITVDPSRPEAAQLIIDDNLVDDLFVSTDDGKLAVGFDELTGEKNPSRRPVLKLSVHSLEKVRANDWANITVTGIHAARFEVEQAGHGHIELSGRAGELEVRASEPGTVDARALSADTVHLDQTDEGDIQVSATVSVTGTLDDEGDVLVYGSPPMQEIDVDGEGEVLMQ